MGTVQKRGKRWSVILSVKTQNEGGETVRHREYIPLPLSVQTKRDALAAMVEIEDQRERVRLGLPNRLQQNSGPRWLDVAADVLSEVKVGNGGNWYSPCKAMVERFRDFVGDVLALKVTPEMCREYVTQRMSSDYSHSTLRKEFRFLRRIFRRAGSTAWDEIKLPSEPKHDPQFLTEEEFYKILKATPNEERKLRYLLFVWTGARPNELLRVKWGDVNFKSRQIVIPNSKKGKGSRLANRTVPIHPELFKALKAHQGKPDELILGGKAHNWRRDLIQDAKRAGVLPEDAKRGVFPYRLRHTFGSWCAQSGVELIEIRDMMGHSSTTTTEIYAHLVPNKHAGVVEKLKKIGVKKQKSGRKGSKGVAKAEVTETSDVG